MRFALACLKLSLALTPIGVTCMHAGRAEAATLSEFESWLGCYEVAVQGDSGLTVTHTLKLTDVLVEHTAGSYRVDVTTGSDDMRKRMGSFSRWWPVGEASIHLQIGDGYAGWSVALESSDTGLLGTGAWEDDTGKRVVGLRIRATKTACEPITKQ